MAPLSPTSSGLAHLIERYPTMFRGGRLALPITPEFITQVKSDGVDYKTLEGLRDLRGDPSLPPDQFQLLDEEIARLSLMITPPSSPLDSLKRMPAVRLRGTHSQGNRYEEKALKIEILSTTSQLLKFLRRGYPELPNRVANRISEHIAEQTTRGSRFEPFRDRAQISAESYLTIFPTLGKKFDLPDQAAQIIAEHLCLEEDVAVARKNAFLYVDNYRRLVSKYSDEMPANVLFTLAAYAALHSALNEANKSFLDYVSRFNAVKSAIAGSTGISLTDKATELIALYVCVYDPKEHDALTTQFVGQYRKILTFLSRIKDYDAGIGTAVAEDLCLYEGREPLITRAKKLYMDRLKAKSKGPVIARAKTKPPQRNMEGRTGAGNDVDAGARVGATTVDTKARGETARPQEVRPETLRAGMPEMHRTREEIPLVPPLPKGEVTDVRAPVQRYIPPSTIRLGTTDFFLAIKRYLSSNFGDVPKDVAMFIAQNASSSTSMEEALIKVDRGVAIYREIIPVLRSAVPVLPDEAISIGTRWASTAEDIPSAQKRVKAFIKNFRALLADNTLTLPPEVRLNFAANASVTEDAEGAKRDFAGFVITYGSTLERLKASEAGTAPSEKAAIAIAARLAITKPYRRVNLQDQLVNRYASIRQRLISGHRTDPVIVDEVATELCVAMLSTDDAFFTANRLYDERVAARAEAKRARHKKGGGKPPGGAPPAGTPPENTPPASTPPAANGAMTTSARSRTYTSSLDCLKGYAASLPVTPSPQDQGYKPTGARRRKPGHSPVPQFIRGAGIFIYPTSETNDAAILLRARLGLQSARRTQIRRGP